jgi:quinohemoprotein amine dehydrogenase beta subunit
MPVKISWVAAALGLVVAIAAEARPKQDYIVTGAKPDHLFVIDPTKQRVVADFHIPEAHNWVATIVPSPDGKVAYVLTNKMESISGIDLSTGKEVFRANLSSGAERVTCFFAFDVTPDGKELIVFEVPVKLGLSEYTVEETRFAVFKTDAGVDAKPVRTFPAPRRVSMVLARKDGKSFYALGFDLFEFDRLTGKQLSARGVRNWEFPNRSIPDVLAVRPISEPTGTFMNPVYSTVPAADRKGTPVSKTTIMSLNLNNGDLQYHDLEEALLLFSTVKSPTRPEAYGVYTDLTKIDMNSYTPVQRVDLDHTYYAVLVSTDGREVYAAGAARDVTIFDSETLAKKGNIELPGDQSATSPRVVRR